MIMSFTSFGGVITPRSSCEIRRVIAHLAAYICTRRTSDFPPSKFSYVRRGTPISFANRRWDRPEARRRALSFSADIEHRAPLCYIFGNRRGCSPSGPQLAANGEGHSPLAEPDLEGELDAHVDLQSGCRSRIASVISLCHHFGGCASENHHFGGFYLRRPCSLMGGVLRYEPSIQMKPTIHG